MYFLDYSSLTSTNTSGIINTFAIMYFAKIIIQYVIPIILVFMIFYVDTKIVSIENQMYDLQKDIKKLIDKQESSSNQENKIIGS